MEFTEELNNQISKAFCRFDEPGFKKALIKSIKSGKSIPKKYQIECVKFLINRRWVKARVFIDCTFHRFYYPCGKMKGIKWTGLKVQYKDGTEDMSKISQEFIKLDFRDMVLKVELRFV